MIGEILGNRYELIEKIGEGGMAIVYKARDNKLNRLVAVKILKREFADNKDIADKFKKEATAIANFSDANIVNVLDVGHEEEGNIDYFVMEYVNGKTLKELIVFNGKLPYVTAINITIQIAKALECAHRNNIIHRDVKPQNILVNENGEVKVTDFGIAKSSTSSTITNTTTIMGSAHYLSPEQAKGTFIDSRTDIYSLGIVLYEMVTGKLPFDGESPVTIALKHIQEEPVEPKKYNDTIPESLNNLIIKAISKESINRYQSCRELINDLQKIKDNPDVVISGKSLIDDSRTIIMEPIRIEEKKSEVKKIYSKDDFNKDFGEEYDDDYDEDERDLRNVSSKRKNKKPLIIVIIIVCILLVGGISFGAFKMSSSLSQINIPNVVGMNFDDAKAKLESMHLRIEKIKTVVSDKPEGEILEMEPKEGEIGKKGDVIKVTVSGGVEKVKVPDLRDYEENYITSLLTQRGLKYEIKKEYSDLVPSGYLISQSPERDTEVPKDSVITLTISQGPEVKLVKVENFVGYNINDAKKALEDIKLKVNIIEKETDRKEEEGKVLEQSLQGTRVEEGTSIILTVGKYVEPTINVGDYISDGMSLEEAVNILNSSNIQYNIVGGTPQDYRTYIIKGFTPSIKNGETVNLEVEKITQSPSVPTDSNNSDNDNNNNDSSDNTEEANNNNNEIAGETFGN